MSRRHPALNREHRILTAQDIMEILGVGQTKAYSIIRKLNAELAEKGVLKESLMGGRIPEKYFYERVFMVAPQTTDRREPAARSRQTLNTASKFKEAHA